MSYVFAENEFAEPIAYVQKMWELTQIERRSPHLPANKTQLLNSMYEKLFSVYSGGDDFFTFSSTIDADLLGPDQSTAVNAAMVYFVT